MCERQISQGIKLCAEICIGSPRFRSQQVALMRWLGNVIDTGAWRLGPRVSRAGREANR